MNFFCMYLGFINLQSTWVSKWPIIQFYIPIFEIRAYIYLIYFFLWCETLEWTHQLDLCMSRTRR